MMHRHREARGYYADPTGSRGFQDRVLRALSQTMFLLPPVARDPDSGQWSCRVESARSVGAYDVELGRDEFSCSCPDFQKRRCACKHLIFVVARCGMLEDKPEVYVPYFIEAEARHSVWADVDASLQQALRAHVESAAEEVKEEEESSDSCFVCFESLSSGGLLKCTEASAISPGSPPPCSAVLHRRCARFWSDRSRTCPLCRHDWNPPSSWPSRSWRAKKQDAAADARHCMHKVHSADVALDGVVPDALASFATVE